MTTANREITSEQGKFDGYAPKRVPQRNYPSVASHYRSSLQTDDVIDDTYNEQMDGGIERKIHNNANVEIKQRPYIVPKKVESEDDDLAPSSKTMNLLRGKDAVIKSSVETSEKRKLKINTRGKASIVGFVVIVVALIIVICLNAVAISSVASSVSNLETQLSASSGELNARNKELSGVTHPDVSNMPSDYVKPDAQNSIDIVIPEIKDVVAKQPPSNWFDSFCNFFSGIFGG